MSEEEFEEYYKKIEPNFNSKIEKGTIEMSNEYYNAIEERMARLINKNNNLQSQLQQKENIIKEVRELCEKQFVIYEVNSLGGKIKRYAPISTDKIMEILDKENEENGRK